jgi:hypothetical protein
MVLLFLEKELRRDEVLPPEEGDGFLKVRSIQSLILLNHLNSILKQRACLIRREDCWLKIKQFMFVSNVVMIR